MDKRFIQLYFEKFGKFFGIPATILSILLGFILWLFLPSETFKASYVISISALSVVIVFPLLMLTFDLFDQIQNNRNPHVLTTFKYPSGDLTILLSKSELFSHDTLVSIYFKGDESFEQLIAFGSVVNIQEDGKIQIGFAAILNGNSDLISKIESKNIDVLKKLTIKPNVSKAYLQLNSQIQ